MSISISPERLHIADLHKVRRGDKIVLSEEVRDKVRKCRKYLNSKLQNNEDVYYGINSGFGSLHDVKIKPSDINLLQENLVRSHACGSGGRIYQEIIRWMLLLKIKNISLGHSAVREEILDQLILMYEEDILPVIYEQGSLGASGDLAPLAHMALPLLGLGEVYIDGRIVPTIEAKDILGEPKMLEAKEGLALLNGTQFMSAHGVYALIHGAQLLKASEHIAALSLDAFNCKLEPFDPLVQQVRQQKGQIQVAQNILALMKGSEIGSVPKTQNQDPYSFRCIPQVHGASYDVYDRVSEIIENEINAVTDNPLIFPEEDKIISGGNFHGQTLAIHLDMLAIAYAEIANISERRTFQLNSGKRDLPDFLIQEPGLNSGLMISQYTAASIVSQNKQLCTPASVDSIVSSNGQEDHVSMGANAATKLTKVLDNSFTVLGIELICASQALHFRKERTSPALEAFLGDFRKNVPIVTHDRVLHYDIVAASRFLKHYKFTD